MADLVNSTAGMNCLHLSSRHPAVLRPLRYSFERRIRFSAESHFLAAAPSTAPLVMGNDGCTSVWIRGRRVGVVPTLLAFEAPIGVAAPPHPITAYEANTGQVLRVQNRAGNVHDGKASVAFLEALFEQLHQRLERRQLLEMRMDGVFFREDVIDLLEAEGVEHAIKVPFYFRLGLKERIASAAVGSAWTRAWSALSSGFRYRHGRDRCVS